MIQGWHNDDYLIIFDEPEEASSVRDRYAIGSTLPDFALVGLTGWDDFILRDTSGKLFTAPTIPLLRERLRPLAYDLNTAKLRPDPKFTDRIKWYIQPLVFGGDPRSQQNMAWLSLDQHTEAVKWWNNKYREHTNA